jgi:hypothetical protein
MPAPVSLVTVHHEGAGAPAAPENIGRCAHGGYTYGFGSGAWERFRDVWSSFATMNFNGDSVDLVLTGNREDHAVTDDDLAAISAAVADARGRGYVVDAPTVRAHRDSPGSSTVCPGAYTMARWSEIVAACTAGSAPAPGPESGGELLTTIASPQTAKPAGRTPTARPVPALACVLLENGAALRGDKPSGANRVWVSSDPGVIAAGSRLLDIAATIDSNGRPDGRGIVALFDLGDNAVGTYQLDWS